MITFAELRRREASLGPCSLGCGAPATRQESVTADRAPVCCSCSTWISDTDAQRRAER